MKMLSPTGKAWVASFFFAFIGALGWLKTGSGAVESFLLLLYYGVLVVNTFFSVRTFAAVTPAHIAQNLFDAALVITYCALAFSFGSVLLFSSITVGLFLLSIAKHLHLKHIAPSNSDLLRRKVKINALGALLSLLAFGFAAGGLTEAAAWTLAATFAVANVYLLAINPMYRSDA